MTVVFNKSMLLWAVGVLQPVSSTELANYLTSVLEDSGTLPDAEVLQRFLLKTTDEGLLVRVDTKPDFFSLTEQANSYFSKKLRFARDKERIFLLRNTWSNRFSMLHEERIEGLDGDSPSQLERTPTEGSGANNTEPCVPRSRYYWPRHSKQLSIETGQIPLPCDEDFELLSFKNISQLQVAAGSKVGDADFLSLGLQIGVSPKLLHRMAIKPRHYYRSFPLKKRSGDYRIINAPRVFLKVVQKYISDYVFCDLYVHPAVHSFKSSHSILTNAGLHVGKEWVANIDIQNFFGSILKKDVARFLAESGFDKKSCQNLASLITLNNSLPQGAPTSPIFSNAYLHQFDEGMSTFAEKSGVTYTRYADDITFSSNEKMAVIENIKFAKKFLYERFSLKLNGSKTRLVSKGGQQRVTGVIVNSVPMPPRKMRRLVRAMAFNAVRDERADFDELLKIKGHFAHFSSFPNFRKSKEAKDLRSLIRSYEKMITNDWL